MPATKPSRFVTIFSLAAFLLAACSISTPLPTLNSQYSREITILYTNDEHGWIEGVGEGQGAANLVGLWQDQEGYQKDGPFLLLSGGDNWTGPAISTWFEGQSTVEVMNEIGYAASVIGNHEFDFGLQALKDRLAEAKFPYLSANLRYKRDDTTPTDLGIQPFMIREIGGLRLGVIGLTTTSTPRTTNPANLTAFDFLDYERALRQVVPQVRSAGVDLVLVPTHVCIPELLKLAMQISDLQVSMLGGGHCNELFSNIVNGIVVISGGYYFTGYSYAKFTYDPTTKKVLNVQYGVRENKGGRADPGVLAIVKRWRRAADADLGAQIGYLEKEIPLRSQVMQDLITESWLASYPQADIALTNLGGMRDRFPAGAITRAEIIGVMPFNDVLVQMKLSGSELQKVLTYTGSSTATGGIHWKGGQWIMDKTEEVLALSHDYSVLVNDFMYAGGDEYGLLAKYDPKAYNTGIDWRDPVINWIVAQKSSPEHPLDELIARMGEN